MVAGMALCRQPPRLDRVREDHGRRASHLVGGVEGIEQVGEVVTGEVADRGVDLRILELAQEPLDLMAAAARSG
jgi:hypothetical protein